MNESENSTRRRAWSPWKVELITCCYLGAAACYFIAAGRDGNGSYANIAPGSMFLLAAILRTRRLRALR